MKLERCRKCRVSKAILRVVRFYGKVSYICQDCERETRDFLVLLNPNTFILTSYFINNSPLDTGYR